MVRWKTPDIVSNRLVRSSCTWVPSGHRSLGVSREFLPPLYIRKAVGKNPGGFGRVSASPRTFARVVSALFGVVYSPGFGPSTVVCTGSERLE